MHNRRVARLNEQLKREISAIIRVDLRDPRVSTATVTGVDATSDLSLARVYIRALCQEEEYEHVLQGLNAATPFIRRELGRRLTLRRVPELEIRWDRSFESSQRIEHLLSEVRPPDGWSDEEPEESS